MLKKEKLNFKDVAMTVLVFAIMLAYSYDSLRGLGNLFAVRFTGIQAEDLLALIHCVVISFLMYVGFIVKDDRIYTILYKISPLLVFYKVLGA